MTMQSWFNKLFKSTDEKKSRIQSFLDGDIDMITSADIDPEGAQLYDNYERAMQLKNKGDLDKAAIMLEKSCDPPSIYKGHYRELFKIWRQKNRDDLKVNNYEPVIERVQKMIRYDDEMIECMLDYWSKVQKCKLALDYFDSDRNLKISDVKAMLKAAKYLGRDDLVKMAEELITVFDNRK